jgi:hypothetical protein
MKSEARLSKAVDCPAAILSLDRMRAGQTMLGVFLVSDLMPIGQAINEILLAVDCLTSEESANSVKFFPL